MSAYPNELNLELYLDRDNLENYKVAQGSWGFPVHVWLKKSDDTLMDLSGCTVRLKAVKSDNTIGYWDGAINNADSTEADWTAQPQMTAAAGDVQLTVEITALESGIQSIPCKLKVVAEPDSQIVSTNDFQVLTQRLSEVSTAVKQAQQASESAEQTLSDVTNKEQEITVSEAARVDAESKRVTTESGRVAAEQSRVTAEQVRAVAETKREADSQTAVTAANAATDKANHMPQRDASGVWKDWDAESKAYKNSADQWKGEKGDTGAAFAYGESYATLEALQTAYPTGDAQGHLVNGTAYIWDGTAWVATSVDLSDYDKRSVADAKYAGINHTHTAAQVGARPDTWMPTASDVGATPAAHVDATVSSESGAHGLRWYENRLQAKSGNAWDDINAGGNTTGFAPQDVTALKATAENGQVTICWSDPADTIVGTTVIAKWAGSKLVRKEGTYPADITDGILLIDNKTRDKYKATGYVDTNLTNGTTYYYAVFPYSDAGAVNKNEANQISTTPRASVRYGVIWHETLSSPVLERIDDSTSFTATATDGSTAGHSDFDDKPIYKDMKVCNVVNRQVVAYEGDATFKRDGSNGDVMVEIPKFYYKVTDNGTDRTYEISDTQLDGFLVAPRHAPCDDFPNGLSKIYVGVYEASESYKSISGVAPTAGHTLPAMRTGFTGSGAGCGMVDWAAQFEIQLLYMVEFANLDSQSSVGNGNVGTSVAINTGGSDSVTGMTGCANKTSQSIAAKYRGMENLWGNIDEWRDGINFDNAEIYVCLNPSKYACDTATNYTKLGYSKVQLDGFISATGLNTTIPWVQVPTAINGNSGTYYCDQYYRNTGWCVALVGGHYGLSSSGGMFYLYSGYPSSTADSRFGSRLLILPES